MILPPIHPTSKENIMVDNLMISEEPVNGEVKELSSDNTSDDIYRRTMELLRGKLSQQGLIAIQRTGGDNVLVYVSRDSIYGVLLCYRTGRQRVDFVPANSMANQPGGLQIIHVLRSLLKAWSSRHHNQSVGVVTIPDNLVAECPSLIDDNPSIKGMSRSTSQRDGCRPLDDRGAYCYSVLTRSVK